MGVRSSGRVDFPLTRSLVLVNTNNMPRRRTASRLPSCFWYPTPSDPGVAPDPDDARDLREEARLARADRLDEELKAEQETREDDLEELFAYAEDRS